jgi:DNA polymerase I-like protein with 3'-5' exonuclease and polymerase domains
MQIPLFEPKSLWRPPTVLPQLGSVVAVDLETCDPYLKQKGAGYRTNSGQVVGIALADEHHKIYLPFGHREGDNLDRHIVLSYVASVIKNAKELIFANATYDLGWLHTLDIKPTCKIRDVQVAEALLDEEKFTYSLNSLSKQYLKVEKDETKLKEAADAYGFDAKGEMWKLAARFVGKYAEADARYTFDIYQQQIPKLKEEGLWDVWELESDLIPVLMHMTIKGVPVNLDAAEQLNTELLKQEKDLSHTLAGLDIWSANQVGEYLETRKVKVPRTEKGNYSVSKAFLEFSTDKHAQQIHKLRGINRLRKVFIEDGILKGHHNGYIHAEFRQTASDEGGTRSGRLSSRNPNMQQVPKRSDIGKAIRQLYIAEEGKLWCKADYSSQEPRLQVHYALIGLFGKPLPKAEEARDAFARGEKLYTFFEKTTGLPYDTCKMLCLGISYGMGNKKMASTLGISEELCKSTMNKFNTEAPFLKILFNNVMNKASQYGSIRTILGRRATFDFWMPDYNEKPLKGYNKAIHTYKDYPKSKFFRAFTSKALNRLIQGSAADQAKKAMVDAYQAGFDLRLPVHDEINCMVNSEKESLDLKLLMENAIPLNVPVIADIDLGKTWC